MEKLAVFTKKTEEYDQWYENHYDFYLAELAAIEKLMPKHEHGIEIGVGTGRFAAPLGIKYGIDPVQKMLVKAAERGIEVKEGFAENLPYADSSFDYALMTTTICFLDDIDKAFAEVARILQKNTIFTVAFIDKGSHLGKKYQQRKESSFYKNANFCLSDDIIVKMKNAGFEIIEIYQTLFNQEQCSFRVLPGKGEGAFVIINGKVSKE